MSTSGNVSKECAAKRRTELLQHNESDAHFGRQDIIPVFDVKALGSFSLADFAELLEAAGKMPTGDDLRFHDDPSAAGAAPMQTAAINRLAILAPSIGLTRPEQPDVEAMRRLRRSRFRFLIEHLQPEDRDPILEDEKILADVSGFLNMLRTLFFNLATLKRVPGKEAQTGIPRADPGQQVFAAFSYTVATGFVVGMDGKLAGRLEWFRRRNPVPHLVQRLSEVLDGADPARVRRCAYSKCGRIFYAKYSNSLCCSRRCNNNRLQREWYENEGKRVERVWTLYKHGKTDLAQISKELGIIKEKARGYLMRAKKEKGQ
ncbi:MAG: hypothetical protein ACLQU2_07915 [Candidatus Binataceae bacterium]